MQETPNDPQPAPAVDVLIDSAPRSSGRRRRCESPASTILWLLALTSMCLYRSSDDEKRSEFVRVAIFSVLSSVALTGVWFCHTVTVSSARTFLWLSQCISVAVLALSGLLNISRWPFVGFTLLILSCCTGLWIWSTYLYRSTAVHYSCVLLEMVNQVVPGSSNFLLLFSSCVILNGCIIVAWAWTTPMCTTSLGSEIWVLFVLFWATQVVKHVVHWIVAQRVLSWYFSSEIEPEYKGDILEPVYSLGPICMGSLLVAPVELIWSILRRMNCAPTVLGWFCHIYEDYNRNGWAYLVLYNGEFSNACRNTWSIYLKRGIQAVLYDDILPTMLTIPTISASLLVSTLTSVTLGLDFILSYKIYCIYFTSINICSEVVVASMCSIYYGFAEDPAKLYEKNAVMFHRLVRIAELGLLEDQNVSHWRSIYGDSGDVDSLSENLSQ